MTPGEDAGQVTVVIPSRNRGALAREAVASVLRQTRPPGEVIVVDDASNPEEARKLAALQGEGVRVLRSRVRVGGSAARNMGWKAATTALVAFLDDDDVWEPTKLGRQIPLFLDPEVGFSWTSYRVVEGPSRRQRSEVRPQKAAFKELLALSDLSNCTLMVRTACLEAIGGYDESLPRNQDWDLFLRLTSSFKGAFLDELLTTVLHHLPDPDACIRGREMLMEKWAPAISSLTAKERREVEAEHHWLLWGNYAQKRDIRSEVKHIGQALRRRPLRWRYLRSSAVTVLHLFAWRGRHSRERPEKERRRR